MAFRLPLVFGRRRSRNGTALLNFSPGILTLEDCFAGVMATGSTGSGKSSSLAQLAVAMLRHSACIVTCAKVSEADEWMGFARAAECVERVVRITPGGPYCLDLLTYELSRPGGSVETVAVLLDKITDLVCQSDHSSGDEFFRVGSKRLNRMCLYAVYLAYGRVGFRDLQRCLISIPRDLKEAATDEWTKSSFLGKALHAIDTRARTQDEDAVYDLLLDYFLTELPALASRTRSCIEAGCTNAWSLFLVPPFSTLFDSGRSTISPEDVTEGGMTWLLDFPVLKFGIVGKVVQFALVCLVQEACLRRLPGTGNPVTLWRDEAQHFLHVSHDLMVSTVARSHRLATVDLTQDYDVLVSALGGGEKARVEADAFAAQHVNRFFFSCINAGTNEKHSAMIGSRKELLLSGGSERDPDPSFLDDLFGVNRIPTVSWSEQYHPLLKPEFLASGLRTGGPANGNRVDAVFFQGGRRFADGQPFTLVTFQQKRFP